MCNKRDCILQSLLLRFMHRKSQIDYIILLCEKKTLSHFVKSYTIYNVCYAKTQNEI